MKIYLLQLFMYALKTNDVSCIHLGAITNKKKRNKHKYIKNNVEHYFRFITGKKIYIYIANNSSNVKYLKTS